MCRKKLDEREERRKAMEAQVSRLWGEETIDLEELIHMQDEARKKAYDELLPLENAKVTSAPANSKDFLVFIDRDLDLDYVTDFPLGAERNTLIAEICAVASLPSKHLQLNDRLAFKRILGGALTCVIEKSSERARGQLATGKDYLKKRTAERSRRWILLSTLPVMGILGYIGYSHQGLFAMEEVKNSPWLVSIYFALLGSFFSMVLRSGRGEMDSASGVLLHMLEVAIRFISGAIAGLAIAFIAISPLCPEIIDGLMGGPGGPQVLGFIAGFSDKFISSFISKYETEK
jgi:hypothetical protein